MIAMDIAEVINPQFAFPVFGVVLCAVLVFAFGFKSSVQPPSFAFEDDGKKSKKPQKKTKVSRRLLKDIQLGSALLNHTKLFIAVDYVFTAM